MFISIFLLGLHFYYVDETKILNTKGYFFFLNFIGFIYKLVCNYL